MECTSSFSLVTDDQMQRNSAKLHQKRFRLDFKKNVFTMMVVKHWNGLPRKVVNAHQCSRDSWIMPSTIYFNFQLALKWSGS